MEGIQGLVFAPVPQFATPICRARQEDIIEKGVRSNFINWPIVSSVDFQILLSVTFRASVDYTLLGCCQVHRRLSFEKFKRKSTGEPEIHVLRRVV